MSSAQHPEASTSASNKSSNRRGRGRYSKNRPQPSGESAPTNERSQTQQTGSTSTPNPSKPSRSRKFGGQLSSNGPDTTLSGVAADSVSGPAQNHRSPHGGKAPERHSATQIFRVEGVNIPDLTNRLIETLKQPPYADCVICWSPIHPLQPTWACTVSEETNRCCWGVFHNKCIVSWSKKNIQEAKAIIQARNEDKEPEWRCPGCQTPRTQPPGPYKCFCGAVVDPKPGKLAMPHSCSMSCQRKRATCEHPCPLSCHPGPCPPCSTLIVRQCYCGSETLSVRCGKMSQIGEMPLACGSTCSKKLDCGNHRCEQICHPGDCIQCTESYDSSCYCGRHRRLLPCGTGKRLECADAEREWVGEFSCGDTCDRQYSCGKHSCTELCHNHSPLDVECPRSPNRITTCHCGKSTLGSLGATRTSCTDPIPSCQSRCGKVLLDCEHGCGAQCHRGSCPPCQVEITLPCRCGETVQKLRCWQRTSGSITSEVTCEKVCRALRNCGKHVCNRPCCPLSHIKTIKAKGRQPRVDPELENLSLHECDLQCSKLLNCGLHRCERKDHKGLCPPCLQSSFDELTCVCGLTTLMPPIPCGTQIQCNYPCSRPPPPCGHPKAQHSCHENEGCPPCPFLTSKVCACGKMTLPNVRCSQPKVSCGKPCGKLLSCGAHSCPRLCHGDECGACESVCGKDRKLCLPDHHPCTHPCHAPSACPEVDSCQAVVTLECPCGRIKRQVPCGRSDSEPAGRSAMRPQCNSECKIAQRNARLAEALGIDKNAGPASERSMATYSPELVAFAKANTAFVKMVERELANFVTSERAAHALPHMPEAKRSFVYNLAKVYRIDSRMIDIEPQRSVELIRRIDTRIPNPLLSNTIQVPAPSLGKLQTSTSASASPARASPALPTTGTRAWAAIASGTSPALRPAPLNPPPRPSASLTNSPAPPLPRSIPADWETDD